jgi:hypothetical protein
MAKNYELEILISATNQAAGMIEQLLQDVGKLAQTLKGVDSSKVEQATTALKGHGVEAKAAAAGLNEAEGASKKLADAMGMVVGAVKLVAGGFLALKAVQVVKDIADTAARAETLGVVLHSIAKNAGIARGSIDDVDKQVQKLGITASASRESLSKFIQAGLNVSDAPKLARAAQDLAVIAGENSSVTFSRLITNIQQRDTLGLRFMGLVLDMNKAETDYARTLGKTTQSLSEQEKQQAVLNAVLEKSKAFAGTYEAAMGSVGKQLTSLARYQDDLKVSVGNGLLPAYLALVEEFTIFLKNMKLVGDEMDKQGTGARSLGENVRAAAQSFREFVEILVSLKSVFVVIAEIWVATKIIAYGSAIAGLSVSVGGLSAAFRVLWTAAGGWLGALIVGGIELVRWAASSDVAKAALAGIGITLSLLVTGPLNLLLSGVAKAENMWVHLMGTIGKASKAEVAAADKKMEARLRELDTEVNDKYLALANAEKDMKGGDDAPKAAKTRETKQVTGEYIAQVDKVNNLIQKSNNLYAQGKIEQSNLLAGEIKIESAKLNTLQSEIDILRLKKDQTEAEKALIKAADDYDAARGKARTEEERRQDARNRAAKGLGIDSEKVAFDDKGRSMSPAMAAAKDNLSTIIRENDKDATKTPEKKAGELKQALENLKGNVTGPESGLIYQEIVRGIDGNGAYKPVIKRALQDAAQVVFQGKQAELLRYETLNADSRAKQKALYEVELADNEGYRNQTVVIAQGAAQQIDETYKLGRTSIAAYYAFQRSELDKAALQDAHILTLKVAQNKIEIESAPTIQAKNSLIAQGIALEAQELVAKNEVLNKRQKINIEERAAQVALNSLYVKTQETLLTALSMEGDAKRQAAAETLRLANIDAKKDAGLLEKNKLLYGLTLNQIAAEEKLAKLANADKSIGMEQAKLDSMRALNLISVVDYEARSVELQKQRVQQAQKELDIVLKEIADKREAGGGDSTALEGKALDAQAKLQAAQIAGAQQFRTIADSINTSFQDASSTFLQNLLSGTMTWKDAMKNAISSLSSSLLKMSTDKLSSNLFSGSDIGGKAMGVLGGKGDSNIFSDLLGSAQKGLAKFTDAIGLTSGASAELAAKTVAQTGSTVIAMTTEELKTAAINTEMGMMAAASMALDILATAALNAASSMGGGGGMGGLAGLMGGGSSGLDALNGAGSTVAYLADGGQVTGPGSGTSDSIPARLSNGEFVVKASATAAHLSLLRAINGGSIGRMSSMGSVRRFAEGGLVGSSGGSKGVGGDVHVQINVNNEGKADTKAGGPNGVELGKMLQNVVTQTIIREKRQGGLLEGR